MLDINECDEMSACHKDANCSNTIGSHNCTCKEGYNGNGTYCEGIISFITKNYIDNEKTCFARENTVNIKNISSCTFHSDNTYVSEGLSGERKYR